MKTRKFIFITLLLVFSSFVCPGFAQDKTLHVYLNSDDVSKEFAPVFEEAFENFKKLVDEAGMQVVLQEGSMSQNGLMEFVTGDKDSSWGVSRLSKHKNKLLEKGYTEEDLIEVDVSELTGVKTMLGVAQKFPYLEIRSSYNSKGTGELSIIYFAETAENVKNSSCQFYSPKENFGNMLEAYFAGIMPMLKGEITEVSEGEAPLYIDSLNLPAKTNVSTASRVVGFNDYSFIMTRSDEVDVVSAACEVGINLVDKLNISESIKKGIYWITGSVDGESILMMNGSSATKNGTVFRFNKNGDFDKSIKYTLSSANVGSEAFSNEGIPYSYYNAGNDAVDIYYGTLDFSEPVAWSYGRGRANGYMSGPEETFVVQRYNSIFIYNHDGSVRKIIHDWSDTRRYNWNIAKVLPDFSCILTMALQDSSKIVKCISVDGKILWQLNLPKGNQYTSVGNVRNGMFYFVNHSTVMRYALPDAPIPSFLKTIGECNRKINENLLENNKLYLTIAEAYMSAGGYSAAGQAIENYLIYNPTDSSAREKLLKINVEGEKKNAAVYAAKALEQYDLYGIESGREEYQNAMKILEKLKRQMPGDVEVTELCSELKKAFAPDTQTSSKVPDLEVVSVDFTTLFPALMNVYTSQPSGYITVKNKGDTPLSNISVTSFLRSYMDFATEGAVVSSLAPGEETVLEVKTILNKKILTVNEDTNVQMQFTLNWECDGSKENIVLVRPVTIYKKSAMSWTDTAMLSCFIMPNDLTVSAFAFKALESNAGASGEHVGSEKQIVSKNFFRALKLVNALGCIPLNYVPDPITPVTSVMENIYAVDTVRFPADTLLIKGGDCDDMTTVVCSVFESAGVPAALITTPGHIFAAFNTGLKYDAVWEQFNGEYLALEYNGEAWIPVECTVLYEGFDSTWKTASKELNAALKKNDEIEFISLAEKRSLYPPVSADDKNAVDVKIKNDNLAQNELTQKRVISEIFVPVLDKQVEGCKDVKTLNAVAKFFYSIDKTDKAIEVLNTALAIDGTSVSVMNNLVALYKSIGQTKLADDVMKKAKRIKEFQQNSVVLNGSDSKKSVTERADDKSDDTVLDSWME